jgi:putative peptidoglycan lipid II flippase
VVLGLTTFVNQLVIARSFGTGGHMDAYLIAISVPFLVMGIVGGIISYGVVPILSGRRLTDKQNYRRFVGEILIAFALLGLSVAVVGYFISPVLLSVLAPALSQLVRPEAIGIARISWITVGCCFIVSYLAAVQNAERRFAWPVLTAMLPFLGMIMAAVLWASRIGTLALAWGMLAGNILSVIVLWLGVNSEISLRSSPNNVWRETQPILAAIPLILISTLCFTVFGTVDAFWASSLGPSNVSYLGYGQRIVIALGTFVIQGPSVVLGPYLSEFAAAGQVSRFRETAARAVRTVLAVTVPVALLIGLLRTPIIELLFQRGAFDQRATAGTTSVLVGMLAGMVAMVNVIILLRALHARRDIRGAAIIGALGATIYFSLSGLFSKWLGLSGIVLSYLITWYLLLGFAIWRIWRTEFMRVFALPNLRFIARLLIASAACAIPVWALWRLIGGSVSEMGHVNVAVRIAALFGLGSLAFLAVSAGIFRMPEIMIFLRPLSFIRNRKNGRMYTRGFLRSGRSDHSRSRVSL